MTDRTRSFVRSQKSEGFALSKGKSTWDLSPLSAPDDGENGDALVFQLVHNVDGFLIWENDCSGGSGRETANDIQQRDCDEGKDYD